MTSLGRLVNMFVTPSCWKSPVKICGGQIFTIFLMTSEASVRSLGDLENKTKQQKNHPNNKTTNQTKTLADKR